MRLVVICFSGKRKSGKDYLCNELKRQLEELDGYVVAVRGISFPLKKEFARIHGLDYELLKCEGDYKEVYRKEMVAWGEQTRRNDPAYFCKLAVQDVTTVDVLIISDCRRQSDIDYFLGKYRDQLRLVRVQADIDTRKSRGFQYVEGIDNAETECGLDVFSRWDFVINNNGNKNYESHEDPVFIELLKIRNFVNSVLSKN